MLVDTNDTIGEAPMINDKAFVEPCRVDTGKAGLNVEQLQSNDKSSNQSSQSNDLLQAWWTQNRQFKPTLTTKDLPQQFANHFEILDIDKNNHVSESDLEYELGKPNLKGDQVVALETLRHFYSTIGRANGLDLGDMKELKSEVSYRYRIECAEEADFLERYWTRLNTDGSRFISDPELKAVDNLKMSDADRVIANRVKGKMASFALSNVDEFVFELSGISRHDIADYSLSNSLDKHLKYLTREMNGLNRALYGESSCNPIDAIKPEAIRQGATDNSVFLAGLASLAATDPEAIQKMISVDERGNYLVKFPGHKNVFIVTPPTDGELLRGVNGQKHGIWPAVLEKAWEQLEDRSPSQNHFALFSDAYDPGYYGPDVMRTLTGRELIKGDVHNQKYVEEQLSTFKKGGAPIIGGIIYHDVADLSFYSFQNGTHGQNSFSVVDYDPRSKMVTLRNTWGDRRAPDLVGQHATPKGIAEKTQVNGVFKISTEQFARTMDFMYIAKKP